jgi:hypothetical protein
MAPDNRPPLPRPPVHVWECPCRRPPVVLGRFDLSGRIAYPRDEHYWQIDGHIVTNCPKCGKQHLLHLTLAPEVLEDLPFPWRSADGNKTA